MPDSELVKIDQGAPDFSLLDHNGQAVHLSDYKTKQNILLYFMREFR